MEDCLRVLHKLDQLGFAFIYGGLPAAVALDPLQAKAGDRQAFNSLEQLAKPSHLVFNIDRVGDCDRDCRQERQLYGRPEIYVDEPQANLLGAGLLKDLAQEFVRLHKCTMEKLATEFNYELARTAMGRMLFTVRDRSATV